MIKGFKWIRPVLIERWKDADTCAGLIDRGDGDLYRPVKGIRLVRSDGRRYDAPENKDEPTRAALAHYAVEQLCPQGTVLVGTSHTLDVYGRPLMSLELADKRDLATVLESLGHVKGKAA